MKSFKILIIDDSDVLCAAIKKFFEHYDFNVLTGKDGLEGIKLATRENPDIIFLDLMMPNFGGIDFLKSVKVLENCRNIPVIVITALTEGERIETAKRLGVTHILYKPIKRSDVFKAVDEVLGDRALSKLQLEKLMLPKENKTESWPDRPVNKLQMQNHLVRVFLKTIDTRIDYLQAAINNRNEIILKSEMHELKGIGPMIGYKKLTILGEYLETLLGKELTEAQWEEIISYMDLMIELLEQIKKEN